jgi:ABC-type proline/glycine betaine transport system permease subunit
MENKVMGPAIGLIVLGILGALTQVTLLLMGNFDPEMLQDMDVPADQREQVEQFMSYVTSGGSVLYVVGIAIDLFVAWAGFQMLKLKSWTAAVVANVLMMIPCFSSCCCIIGVPLGIWGLIVLFNKDVKSAFVAKEAA